MTKATYDDMFELVKEIERGSKDKTRNLSNINNKKVKKILESESSMAIKNGVTAAVLGRGAITSAIIGTVGGAGTGYVSSEMGALGGAALGVVLGAEEGGTLGSVVPVLGTIVGAVVGAGVGIFVGTRIKKKEEEKKELLHEEVEKKQNTIIRDLEKEVNELENKYAEKVEQDERYKYIIGLLMSNEELKKV